mmetsp:Transcript_1293/g.3308  ORF Transcript_1293/g.3308 Transcript_1293/m.3308 type:complete len:288 (-) Transcript_1293:229-1092(-)
MEEPHQIAKLPVEVAKDLHRRLQAQDRRLLAEDGLRGVAEVHDLARPQDEGPVCRWLPRVRPQQLLQDPLVNALEGSAPLEDRRELGELLDAAGADPPPLVLELVDAELPDKPSEGPFGLRVRGHDDRAVVQPHVRRGRPLARGGGHGVLWGHPAAVVAPIRSHHRLKIRLALVQALERHAALALGDLHGRCGLRLRRLDQRRRTPSVLRPDARQPQVPGLGVGVHKVRCGRLVPFPALAVVGHEHVVQQQPAPQSAVDEDHRADRRDRVPAPPEAVPRREHIVLRH